MSRLPDYYGILGVHPLADEEVIGAAYRALAKKYHPDTGNVGSAARFVEIQEAYEVLRDPERRVAYDTLRRTEADNDAAQGSGPTDGPAAATGGMSRQSSPAADSPANRSPQRPNTPKSHVGIAFALGCLVITSTVLLVEIARDRNDRPETETLAAVGNVTASEDAPKVSLAEPGAVVGDVREKSITSRLVGDREVEPIQAYTSDDEPLPHSIGQSVYSKQVYHGGEESAVEEPPLAVGEESAPEKSIISRIVGDREVGEPLASQEDQKPEVAGKGGVLTRDDLSK